MAAEFLPVTRQQPGMVVHELQLAPPKSYPKSPPSMRMPRGPHQLQFATQRQQKGKETTGCTGAHDAVSILDTGHTQFHQTESSQEIRKGVQALDRRVGIVNRLRQGPDGNVTELLNAQCHIQITGSNPPNLYALGRHVTEFAFDNMFPWMLLARALVSCIRPLEDACFEGYSLVTGGGIAAAYQWRSSVPNIPCLFGKQSACPRCQSEKYEWMEDPYMLQLRR